MDAHSVLVAARNLVDGAPWGQGPPACRAKDTRCIEQALAKAEGFSWWADEALEDLPTYQLLRELAGGVLWHWNDAEGRTKQEVLDLFDRAIAATAPAPPFESLGQEPATERERLIQDAVFA